MNTVSELSILEQLSTVSIAQDLSEEDSVQAIAESGLGAILVLEVGRLVGFLSHGDSYNRVSLTSGSFDEASLREIISQNGVSTSYEEITERCLALTKIYDVRHLPVFVDGYLIGLVSIKELGNVIDSYV